MCAVKLFLGIPCPGCGLLHALWYAAQAEWGRAFAAFPLWPAVILFACFFRRLAAAGRCLIALLLVQWVWRLVI